MKLIIIALAAVAVLGGGRFVSHRLATHQRVVPNPLARINTQVHRINQ
ncbi:hypothetical protein [Nocardioides sp. LS1]|nr:hypothetical protein [Nocardioides sp. LS1]GCD88602.1 hypothetical protein NLS1_06080 [Nocardioides sp. LS1]